MNDPDGAATPDRDVAAEEEEALRIDRERTEALLRKQRERE